MKASSILIAALLLIAGAAASGQTSMIAHRSHGGSDETFAARGGDNFGISPQAYRKVDSVLFLNDSTVIEFSNLGTDTIYNDPASPMRPIWSNRAVTLDSLRKLYPSIKFIHPDTTHRPTGSVSNGRHGSVMSVPLAPLFAAALALPLLGVMLRKLRNRPRD